MNQRLKHDAAHAAACALLDTVKSILRVEEWRDFHAEATRICSAMLDSYEVMKAREAQRLKPSKN